jgi:hypothetical protein
MVVVRRALTDGEAAPDEVMLRLAGMLAPQPSALALGSVAQAVLCPRRNSISKQRTPSSIRKSSKRKFYHEYVPPLAGSA